MAAAKAPISASDKTLMVLEAAVRSPRFSDIVEDTGLAKTTTHRLLAGLVAAGYLDAADGSYRVGPRMVALSGEALARVDVSDLAEPVMASVVARTGCAVNLVARAGDVVVYLRRRYPDKPYRVSARIGSTNPLHITGTGKAMLARMSDAEIAAYADRTQLVGQTRKSLASLDELMAQIEQIRVDGFAVDDEESELGVRCVAAAAPPVVGGAEYAFSAMTLALEHSVPALRTFGPAIVDAARELFETLGGRPEGE